MTTTFSASLEAAGQLAEDELEAIFRGAAQDASELMTRRQAGVADSGGTFREGFVPVDTGELINSVSVTINGAVTGSGGNGAPPDFVASLGAMTFDDVAEVVFTAAHARPMEYGFRIADDNDPDDDQYAGGDVDVAGRFFVRNTVQSWEQIVMANAEYIKS